MCHLSQQSLTHSVSFECFDEISSACEFMNTYCRSLIYYELRSETRWKGKKLFRLEMGFAEAPGLFRHQMEVNSVAAISRYHLNFELPYVHISPASSLFTRAVRGSLENECLPVFLCVFFSRLLSWLSQNVACCSLMDDFPECNVLSHQKYDNWFSLICFFSFCGCFPLMCFSLALPDCLQDCGARDMGLYREQSWGKLPGVPLVQGGHRGKRQALET